MELFNASERNFFQQVSALGYCNPFLPERIAAEQRLLGSDFVEGEAVWSLPVEAPDTPDVNPLRITERVEARLQASRQRLWENATASDADLRLYEDAALWVLYHHTLAKFGKVLLQPSPNQAGQRFSFYREFVREWESYFHVPGFTLPTKDEAPHLFACFFQIRRAFHYNIRFIIGSSTAAARLRATVWESIFTPDMRRYRYALYDRMGDFPTLILGPSGSGKELVARAIGLSRYVPFNPATLTFAEDFTEWFHAINLSALSPTLVESELFGHRRGAFTGARQDRKGWLEVCRPLGTVFLDEIGDVDPSIQVKLLRVMQTRTFQPVGDTTDRHFRGKLIAATNRDLAKAMHQGRFREDFYYRLCADLIRTPSLREQLSESPQVLHELVFFIAQQEIRADAEALTAEVEAWIETHLGPDYPWPGNIRELEQCVRNILIHRTYHPQRAPLTFAEDELAVAAANGALTADELLRWYCTMVYAQTGNYEETARRLQLDPRTVKGKVASHLFTQHHAMRLADQDNNEGKLRRRRRRLKSNAAQ